MIIRIGAIIATASPNIGPIWQWIAFANDVGVRDHCGKRVTWKEDQERPSRSFR